MTSLGYILVGLAAGTVSASLGVGVGSSSSRRS